MKAYYRYSGEFLPMIENVEKLSIIRGFLNSQFLNVSRFLIEFYLKKEEYGIIEEICMKNLADNYLDENINAILVLALVKQDKITLAKEHYNKVTSALKDDLGNATIRKMKYYLNYNVNNAEERNIFSIQDDLIETKTRGAYSCDYDFFKKSYRLEARKSIRNRTKKTLAVLTITPKNYIKNNLEIYNLVLEETSNILEKVILNSLRLGDIVCKYSMKQFLILLDCDENGVVKAINRIKKDFLAQDKYERVSIDYSYAAIAVAKMHIDDEDILKLQ